MRRGWLRACFLILLGCAPIGDARSEISTQSSAAGTTLLYIFGKTSDPDPWPSFGRVRPGAPASSLLNENGDLHGDKRPDLAFHQGSAPAVVWSYWDGSDFEIAYSEWTGAAWTQTLLLTDNVVDDLDPKIAIDASGQPVLAWWRSRQVPAVFSRRRSVAAIWEPESQVSPADQHARIPSVAVPSDGQVRISYEVNLGSTRQVVVARDDRTSAEGPPAYTPEIVATTPYTGQTSPQVERRGSRALVTWVHSDSEVGWSENPSGSWSVPAFEPYSGTDDVDAARFRIKNRLGP